MKIYKILTIFLILALTCSIVSAEKINVYKTDGKKINMKNKNFATDPTYDELIDFLSKNDVSEKEYKRPKYTCGHFAQDLHNAAEKAGIRAGIVVMRQENGKFHHAFNMFDTVDEGFVFIDAGYASGFGMGDCIVYMGENRHGYTVTSTVDPTWTISDPLSGGCYNYEYYW
jgi:hypothetical protein